jgi:hypothetical protein
MQAWGGWSFRFGYDLARFFFAALASFDIPAPKLHGRLSVSL